MTNMHANPAATDREEKKFGCLQVAGIVLLTIIVTMGVTLWVAKTYIFPSQFKPVTLSSREERQLSEKLKLLNFSPAPASAAVASGRENGTKTPAEDINAPLAPEAYSEKGANREITFTERELNAMLAKNTDLATKMAIDLSDDLISARLRIPVDPDFPFFGGKTLRAAAGLTLAYRQEKPVVILKGVKLMGVPIPNAWLGGLKNIDLVQEFGEAGGFWQVFSEGVDSMEVRDGKLTIQLKE